jgi:DNA primase
VNVVTVKEKLSLIKSIFGEGVVSSNGRDVAVYCPVCRKNSKVKKKRKLSICIDTGVYHCWVCEAKGKNIARFVQNNFPNFKSVDKVVKTFNCKFKEKESKKEEKNIFLPEDFKLVATSDSITARRIKKYLKKRGMSEEDLFKFKVGYSFEASFNNRIIFPSLDNNLDLNFYLTRVWDDTSFLSYKNCDASKKEVIFNEYHVDWNKPVVLVEGLFDSVKAGENSIPILGSWIDSSYRVFAEIVKNKTPVILCLDPDAKHKEIKIAKNLSSYGIEVKITQNIDKDMGDMSKEEAKRVINNAKHFDNMIRVRYLINGIKSGSMF